MQRRVVKPKSRIEPEGRARIVKRYRAEKVRTLLNYYEEFSLSPQLARAVVKEGITSLDGFPAHMTMSLFARLRLSGVEGRINGPQTATIWLEHKIGAEFVPIRKMVVKIPAK